MFKRFFTSQNTLFASLFVVFSVVVLLILIFRGSSKVSQNLGASNSFKEKQLSGIEIREATDFSLDSVRFKLYVLSSSSLLEKPLKILLSKKNAKETELELPLLESINIEDCLTHSEMGSMDMNMDMMKSMKVWESNWFFVPELTYIENSYSPKLNDDYNLKILYDDGNLNLYTSLERDSAVCYQIPKTIPMTPIPEYDKSPKED